MLDLAAVIAEWRKSFTDLFRDREEVLDEFESHIWDVAERLHESGLPPEEAVRIAAEQLGYPEMLAAEFAKVPAPPLPWWPARLAWCSAAILAVGVVTPFVPRFANGGVAALLAAHVAGVTLGYAATILVACLSGWLLLCRLFHIPRAGHITAWHRTAIALTTLATVLTAVGIAFGTRCPFEKNGWCAGLDTREVGGIVITFRNLAVLIYLYLARPTLTPLLVGAVGCAVVVLGWLAAARVENQSYGVLNSIPMISLLLAFTTAVGLTALAPPGCLRVRE